MSRTEDGAFSVVSQLLPDTDVAGRFDRYPASAQIPRFIRGEVIEMVASSVNSVLAVRTLHPSDGHVIYLYKWFDESGRRVLTSWMRWLVGPEGTTEVLGMHFHEDQLRLCTRRKALPLIPTTEIDEVFLEKINVADQGSADPEVDGSPAVDTGGLNDFRFFIDRRVSEEQCEVYQHSAAAVGVRLPYRIQTDDNAALPADVKTWILTREVSDGAEGEVFTHSALIQEKSPGRWHTTLILEDPDGELWARWSQGGIRFFAGQAYNLVFEPSQPVKRRERGNGAVETLDSSRLQVIRAHLTFNQTGYAKVTVGPALHKNGSPAVNRLTTVNTWPLLKVSDDKTLVGNANIRDDTMSVPIKGRATEYRMVVENDSPFPSNLHQIELSVNVTRRDNVRS